MGLLRPALSILSKRTLFLLPSSSDSSDSKLGFGVLDDALVEPEDESEEGGGGSMVLVLLFEVA